MDARASVSQVVNVLWRCLFWALAAFGLYVAAGVAIAEGHGFVEYGSARWLVVLVAAVAGLLLGAIPAGEGATRVATHVASLLPILLYITMNAGYMFVVCVSSSDPEVACYSAEGAVVLGGSLLLLALGYRAGMWGAARFA